MKRNLRNGICLAAVMLLVAGGLLLALRDTEDVFTVNDTETGTATQPGPDATGFTINAKAAVLMDSGTGEVLYFMNGDERLPPASVTKIMTMLLLAEAADSGRITLEDPVTISQRAASMGGSQMYMEPGEQHTVAQLMQGIAMVSANDACVACAEYLAGSVEIFVEQMNNRAGELHMKNTNFVNTNGLPVADHYSSAYDIAVMSRALLRHDFVKEWLTTWQDTITVGLPGKQTEFGLTNTNRLIKQYSGAIGIKTGFTQDAGYCLSGAAERDGMTLIAVVLGCADSKTRFAEAGKLLDYGFAAYDSVLLAEKGQAVTSAAVGKGNPQSVDLLADCDITCLVRSGGQDSVTWKIEIDTPLTAPIQAGDELGRAIVCLDGIEIERFVLRAAWDVKKASVSDLYIRMMKKLI